MTLPAFLRRLTFGPLMLACSARIVHGDAADCLAHMAAAA